MIPRTYWELSDYRNIFRLRHWKTGFSFWPVHFFSFVALLCMEMEGFKTGDFMWLQWFLLLPLNILVIGIWLTGYVLRKDPGLPHETFLSAGAKLFLVSLAPAFSLTLLLALIIFLGKVFVGAVPDFSPASYVFSLAVTCVVFFLIPSILILPYGVATNTLYLKAS